MIEPRQQRFIDEYLKDYNGTQAAIRAGYSKRTAVAQASRLLSKANIAASVAARKQAAAQRLEMSAEEVRQAFSKIGRYDPRNLYASDGSLKPITELDDDTAAAISSFEVIAKLTKGGKGKASGKSLLTKVRTYDKVAALTQLGRIHGLFQDKVQVDHRVTLEALVLGVVAREETEAAQGAAKAKPSAPLTEPLTIEGTVEETE